VSRTIVIRVGPVEQARRELVEDLDAVTQRSRVRWRREIWFASLAAAAATLTDRRLALLQVICEKRPRSTAQLAQLIRRGQSAVNADVRVLVRLGLVEVVREGSRQRPVARFDRIQLAGDLTIARAAA
jgi:predicted transcriptional regulator